MQRKEVRQLALHWRSAPRDLADELQSVLTWIEKHSAKNAVEIKGQRQNVFEVKPEAVAEGQRWITPIAEALRLYCRQQPNSRLAGDLLEPVVTALQSAAETGTAATLPEQEELTQAVAILERMADSQSLHQSEQGRRSDLLKATIEEVDDEIIVKTDQDGSLKLRGSTNIPMFLAFWNAPGHKLSTESFLDIDRSVKPLNLERHRNRLSGRLQGVLLEIVEEKNGARLRKCP